MNVWFETLRNAELLTMTQASLFPHPNLKFII